MTRNLALAAVVIIVGVAVYLFGSRNRMVEFSGLTFEVSGKTVHYEFTVQNVTSGPVKFRVFLLANDFVTPVNRFGIGVLPAGQNRSDISLAPHELRTMSGTFDLPVVPKGSIRLTPQFELLSSNQSTDPALASGTPGAEHQSRLS